MAKKRPQKKAAGAPQVTDGEVPVVGAREPCPCGSGRRYKACHGRGAAHAVTGLVRRPFEGLAASATGWRCASWCGGDRAAAPEGRVARGVPSVTLATVLPMAWPALRRDDGSMLLALQNDTSSGDLSRDLADTLQRALETGPGTPVPARRVPAEGPRLQDLLDPEAGFEPVLHTGFEFWVPESAEGASPEVAASLERANAAAIPTVRLPGAQAAYWCETPEKNHLRWVMPHPEEELLDALARLHAAGASSLGEGTRLVGSFRAHGLVVPVWDLPSGMTAEDCEKPAAVFAERLAGALASEAPLTAEERRARGGLTNRQVTLS